MMNEINVNCLESLYNWYVAHSISEDEKWYFDMILSLNGMDLFDTILCLYINGVERSTIDTEHDVVFDFISKDTKLKLLPNTMTSWENYVYDTKEVYGPFYEEMERVFCKFIERFPKSRDKDLCYKQFVLELLWVYQRSMYKPTLKQCLGRILSKIRKEK